jgi:transposase
MKAFKTPERLASWAGLRPGNNESAGKRYSGRTHQGNRWICWIWGEAAQAAVRTERAFQAKFKNLIRRWGHKKSIVAISAQNFMGRLRDPERGGALHGYHC